MRKVRSFSRLVRIGFCLLLWVEALLPCRADSPASPFASGKWVKVAVSKSGVYRISYEALRKAGFASPERVGVYGYGGALLSERLADAPREVLPPVPVAQQGDALYFYGEGTTTVHYNAAKARYERSLNHYATEGYYFLSDVAEPVLISGESPAADGSAPMADYFDAFALHEEEMTSLKQSGRLLVGEPLSMGSSRKVTIPLQGGTPLSNSEMRIYAAYVALPATEAYFELSIGGKQVIKDRISRGEDGSHSNFLAGIRHYTSAVFPSDGGTNAEAVLRITPATDKAYLDYLFVHYKARPHYTKGTQLALRRSDGSYRFSIADLPANAFVWAVDSPNDIHSVEAQNGAYPYSAVNRKGGARRLVVCAPEDAYNIGTLTPVANQDIHGYEGVPELMIICAKAFRTEADRLARFHSEYEGIRTIVMTQEELFNEFSSGTPDATAYRLMAKYFYDRYRSSQPSADPTETKMNLLLFGDGAADNRLLSYDWKALKQSGTEMLLTYQSVNSLNIDSYTADDYFAYLLPEDDDKSNGEKRMTIGVGRFTVRTKSEARAAVDKCISYASELDPGAWKTRGCFVADNGDGYGHLRRAEQLANMTGKLVPELMMTKVYFDAFPKQTANGLTTFPGARRKLMDAFDKGLLFVNYTGHGNPSAWSDEQILTVADIQRFNFPHCPLWVTATCDFANFDSPMTSAGERAFLNEKSAAIALYTTTRVVIDLYNQDLNEAITNSLFGPRKNNIPATLGTVLKEAKNAMITTSHDTINKLNFLLIGDPALKLKMPTRRAVVSTLNEHTAGSSDTVRLKALEKVSVKGYVATNEGAVDGDFTGSMAITVFDAEQKAETLESNIPAYLEKKQEYSDFPGLIYAGNARVENGYFDFSFIVPKDVSYGNGAGRINLYAYAESSKLEAMGVDRSLKIVPGSPGSTKPDTVPPEIRKCFLNDSTAMDNFLTGSTPLFVAELYDESGLNLSESGLGHRITLCLDEQFDHTYSLNNYYEASTTETGLGRVAYTLPEIAEGDHTATLTVWDVYNNMATKTIRFRVNKDLAAEAVVVSAFPNPVPRGSEVCFRILTNQPREEFTGSVELIDFTGRVVAKSNPVTIKSDLNAPQEVRWTPTTSYATYPQPGLYLYRWTIIRNNGRASCATGKLVILGDAAQPQQTE